MDRSSKQGAKKKSPGRFRVVPYLAGVVWYHTQLKCTIIISSMKITRMPKSKIAIQSLPTKHVLSAPLKCQQKCLWLWGDMQLSGVR